MKRVIGNVIEVVALLSASAMVAGLFGKWHFLLDLGSHFRIQAAGTLVLCGTLLFFSERRRRAVCCLVLGLGLAASLWPFLDLVNESGDGTYRLLTMNVLSSNSRHEDVINYIQSKDPDFIVLQETTQLWIDSLDAAIGTKWPYRKSVPRSDNFGIALYSKLPWQTCEVVELSETRPTPVLSALFQMPDGQRLRLIAVHPLPPIGQDRWRSRNSLFAGLAFDIKRSGSGRTIVAGDFNCTPWSYWFRRLLEESGLRNSADGQGLGVTWTPIPIVVFGLPIDHALVGPGIVVASRNVGPVIGSDHRPVVMDFE